MRQIAPNNRKRNINWRPADPREARWPRSRQGLLPSSSSSLLTVQTFLYPDKTISQTAGKGVSATVCRGRGKVVARKAGKGGDCCVLQDLPPCSTLYSTRIALIWWSNRDGCMAIIPATATAHLPAQPFQNYTVASSLLHHAGHCMTERNIPLNLFHYFTSRVKLAISHGHG